MPFSAVVQFLFCLYFIANFVKGERLGDACINTSSANFFKLIFNCGEQSYSASFVKRPGVRMELMDLRDTANSNRLFCDAVRIPYDSSSSDRSLDIKELPLYCEILYDKGVMTGANCLPACDSDIKNGKQDEKKGVPFNKVEIYDESSGFCMRANNKEAGALLFSCDGEAYSVKLPSDGQPIVNLDMRNNLFRKPFCEALGKPLGKPSTDGDDKITDLSLVCAINKPPVVQCAPACEDEKSSARFDL